MRTSRPVRICRRRLLRHVEVDVDGIERLQLHDRIATRQVLTEVDLSDAENSGERRANRLALDGRTTSLQRAPRVCLLSAVALSNSAREITLSFNSPCMRSKLSAGQIALRLGRCQLRALLSCVELDQHLALPHGLARVERDTIDGAREVGADRDTLHSGDRSDRAQACRATRPAAPRSSSPLPGGGWNDAPCAIAV